MKNNKSLFSLHSNNSPPSFLFQKDKEGRIRSIGKLSFLVQGSQGGAGSAN